MKTELRKDSFLKQKLRNLITKSGLWIKIIALHILQYFFIAISIYKKTSHLYQGLIFEILKVLGTDWVINIQM